MGSFPQTELLNVLGIFPIAQTLIPQMILVVITVITFVIQIRRNRQVAKAADHAESVAKEQQADANAAENGELVSDRESASGDEASPDEGSAEA